MTQSLSASWYNTLCRPMCLVINLMMIVVTPQSQPQSIHTMLSGTMYYKSSIMEHYVIIVGLCCHIDSPNDKKPNDVDQNKQKTKQMQCPNSNISGYFQAVIVIFVDM